MASALNYFNGWVSWTIIITPNNRVTFREDGPCSIEENGSVFFSQLDYESFNRRKGPSLIRPNGSLTYHNVNGGIHRTDGPAVIYALGGREYWVNDRKIPANEFFLKYGVL